MFLLPSHTSVSMCSSTWIRLVEVLIITLWRQFSLHLLVIYICVISFVMFTHANGSCKGVVFSVVCLSVYASVCLCLSVFSHYISKTAAVHRNVPPWVLETHLFWGQGHNNRRHKNSAGNGFLHSWAPASSFNIFSICGLLLWMKQGYDVRLITCG